MNENIIKTISSEMNRYLNNYQMSKLQEVLYRKVEIEKKYQMMNMLISLSIASSGIRISELVNLNKDDINFENKSCLVFGEGKKMREVYFDGKAKLHMEEYLNNRTDDNEALFVSNNKPYNRLQSRGIELMLQKLGKELGEEKVHPHKFRRTLAIKVIDKGMPIE